VYNLCKETTFGALQHLQRAVAVSHVVSVVSVVSRERRLAADQWQRAAQLTSDSHGAATPTGPRTPTDRSACGQRGS